MIRKALKSAAIASSLGRVAIGVAFIVDPDRFGRLWIGRNARHGSVSIVTRALGARDVALGLGTAAALLSGSRGTARGWLVAQAACDSVDFAATAAAADRIPESSAQITFAAAGGSTVLSLLTAAALGPDEPERPDPFGSRDTFTQPRPTDAGERADYSPGPRANQEVDGEAVSAGTEKLESVAGN